LKPELAPASVPSPSMSAGVSSSDGGGSAGKAFSVERRNWCQNGSAGPALKPRSDFSPLHFVTEKWAWVGAVGAAVTQLSGQRPAGSQEIEQVNV